ncbi:MAG: type III secretion system export apparatus subunit SctS [Luteimonas sp.]
MNTGDVIQLTKDALWLVLLLSAPPIVAASIVGLIVAFLQAATQLQEQTFAYTVKFIAVVVTIAVTASLVGSALLNFSERVFSRFPGLVY